MPHGQPDLLFYFSDQHHGRYAGYAGHPKAQTPNLDRLACDGTVFETAYTACPLCVPARSAMLSGQLISHNGVFGNAHSLWSDQATFLHALAAVGYETILCGRMHFKGPDQRHGFTARICGDITSLRCGGIPGAGEFDRSFGMGGCADLAGAGDSPVLEYDRAVIAAALNHLQQDHDRPQCIVVGTYGPHFPYVAPPEYFELYHNRIAAPASWNPEGSDPNPVVDAKRQRTRRPRRSRDETPVTTAFMLAARAAYLGMITEQDRLVGLVHDAWSEYLDRTGREGVFAYSSDHGDTCGEHGLFGKQTFYEGATRIPLVFEGCGIRRGARLRSQVSILDIGPTFCDLAGAPMPPAQDGMSLVAGLRTGEEDAERPVLSEWVQPFEGRTVAGRMVRQGPWKLMHYDDERVPDQLFHVETDPEELRNCAGSNPDVRDRLMAVLANDWNADHVAAWFDDKQRHIRMIYQGGKVASCEEPEEDRRPIPAAVARLPEVVY
jgi:choline-sulfatase